MPLVLVAGSQIRLRKFIAFDRQAVALELPSISLSEGTTSPPIGKSVH
jgi:hypothetical protein